MECLFWNEGKCVIMLAFASSILIMEVQEEAALPETFLLEKNNTETHFW